MVTSIVKVMNGYPKCEACECTWWRGRDRKRANLTAERQAEQGWESRKTRYKDRDLRKHTRPLGLQISYW